MGIFLRETVESIQAQKGDFTIEKILIVDDRSSDTESRDILKELAATHENVQVLTNTGPRGPGAARNTGISRVKNTWTAFLDADDIWPPDSLAKRLFALTDFPNAQWIGGDFYVWNPEKEPAAATPGPGMIASNRVLRPYFESAFQTGRPMQLESSYEAFIQHNLTTTGTIVARTEFLQATGCFNPALRVAEDYHLWIRMARRSPFIFVPCIAEKYRQHSASITREKRPMRQYTTIAFQKLYAEEEQARIKRLIKRRIAQFEADNAEFYIAHRKYWTAVNWLCKSMVKRPFRRKTIRRLLTTLIKAALPCPRDEQA